jgi:hypothetical protein
MAETEQLNIQVQLIDNASAGLKELQKQVEALGGGKAASDIQRFQRGFNEAHEKGLKPFTEDLTEASKRMVPFIGGIGGIATGLLAVGYAADKALDALDDFAKAQERIGVLAKQTGFDPAFVKMFQEKFKLVGVDDATRDLQGLAHVMADITRANSDFRRKMMAGAGLEGAGAMQEFLTQLTEIKDPTKFANKLREGLDNIRKNAIAKWGEVGGTERFRKFEADIGMPDLDRLKKDLPAVSAEEKKIQADRQKAADDYNQVSREIDEHWEHIKAAWWDQAITNSPLMTSMRWINDVLKQWEETADKQATAAKEHPATTAEKLNPFSQTGIEYWRAQKKAAGQEDDISTAPLKQWWDKYYGPGATPPAPATSTQSRPGGRVRPGGGAVPLMGGLAPDEWPESTNIEDRRGEAPFQPGQDEEVKIQQELMEQTKRLAEDFERLFADFGGAAGLATGLAADAGLNDIGNGKGGGGRGGVGGLGLFSGGTGGGGGVGPNGSDVGPGTGPGAGATPAGGGPAGVGLPSLPAQEGDISGGPSGTRFNQPAGTPEIGPADRETVKLANGQTVTVNKKTAAQFGGFFNDLIKAGAPVKGLGGIGTRGNPSEHPGGFAVDWAQSSRDVVSPAVRQWMGQNRDTLNALEQKWGMSGGEHWRHPDTGHFSIATLYGSKHLQALRGGGDGKTTASAAPPGGADPGSQAPPAAAGANENNPIAAERARVMKQLQEPGMRELVANVISHENEGEKGRADVLESLVNRAVVTGKSPRSLIYSGFYGPVNRGKVSATNAPAWALKDYDQAAAEVAAGRNVLGGRVDQGMRNEVAPGGRINVGGEYYGWMGLKGEHKTAAARGLDRAATDAQMAQKVEGTGKLSVNVNAPKGTSVNAEGGGLFKKTEVTRQTQMEPAASSMASQYQE